MPLSPTVHRTIVVVDVAEFTRPDRTVPHQLAVQEGLYDVLWAALAAAGADPDDCVVEDRGDGALILLPPSVSKSELADKLPDRLAAEIRRYNATRDPAAQFKLRVGLHAGDIRRNEHGWVGNAVVLACRILDAEEAKSELGRSEQLVALIASSYFYEEVIAQDPASAPGSYRRIAVSVKSYEGYAWLRLHGGSWVPGASPAAAVAAPDDDPLVRDLFPEDELKVLQSLLAGVETARLPMIVSRATRSSIPVPRFRSVWDAFLDLADINAGPDGIPPAIEFLELLAADLGDNRAAELSAWVAQKVHNLRRTPEQQQRQVARIPLPAEPRLYLMIVVELDAIDDSQCVLSWWRQDDPLDWPPPCGGVCELAVDELEQRIDDVIIEAESAWSDQAISVALEFVMPRPLFHLPIMNFRKESRSEYPRPLVYDYPLALRSLERMRSAHWHRLWRMRWDSAVDDTTSLQRIHPYGSAETKENPIDAVLSENTWIGLVMDEPPSAHPDPGAGPDALTAALRSGLPLVVWHPRAGAEDLRELVSHLVTGDGGIAGVPRRHRAAHLAATDDDLIGNLVVLLDDPHRKIVPGGPHSPTSSGGRK